METPKVSQILQRHSAKTARNLLNRVVLLPDKPKP